MNSTISETTHDERETESRNLLDLPDDILFTIFSYCDRKSLGLICQTCSKLRELSSRDCVWGRWINGTDFVVVPNIGQASRNNSPKFPKTTKTKRNRKVLKENLRISRNWEMKKYNDVRIVKHKSRLIPWLRLHGRQLYVSNATSINCYYLSTDGTVKEDTTRRISAGTHDVTQFVINDDVLVSGFRGGHVAGFCTTTEKRLFDYTFSNHGDTQTVSVYNDTVIAGFRDGTIKMINTRKTEGEVFDVHRNQNNNGTRVNRVWSSAISPDGSLFTIGNAGHESNRSPVEVYDMESRRLVHSLGNGWRKGAGILDIKYESPHTLLTCGYDTCLRMWDLRTQTCVGQWTEPFDAELSCIQTDRHNAIVTGTFQYGVTRLWDKRQNEPVQLYYCGEKRSPVYSLDTDFHKMFVALDYEIHMLDFTTFKA